MTTTSAYFNRIQQELLERGTIGFVLRVPRVRFKVHKITNVDAVKTSIVLTTIDTDHYYARQIRSTYRNRRLLTVDRFRASWGDEIALSKRLLLIR